MTAAVPGFVLGPLIPSLFVIIFAVVLRERRDDDRLRWWIGGWLWQCVATLPLDRLLAPHVRGAALLGWFALTAASACFLISSPARRHDSRGAIYTAVALGIPATIAAALITVGNPQQWLLYACVVFSEVSGVIVVSRRFRSAALRVKAAAPFAMFGLWLCICVWRKENALALSVIHAEILALNILMTWVNHPRRTLGFFITQLGFAGWLMATPAMATLLHLPGAVAYLGASHRVLGIGMVLLLMEEGLAEAQRQGKRFKTIFDQSPHMMWMVDPETMQIVGANEMGAEAHGYSVPEFEQLNLADILEPSNVERTVQKLRQPKAAQGRASMHLRKDRSLFPIDAHSRLIEVDDAAVQLVMAVDVTERENLYSDVLRRSTQDDLTGLMNRKAFHVECDRIMAAARATGEVIALTSFNISHFKNVNDTYGDEVGDQCLRALAALIRSHMRTGDIAARPNGDHFKVLMRGFERAEDAEAACMRLMEAMSEPTKVDGVSVKLEIKMGIAIAPEDGRDGVTLRHRAISSMTRARKLPGAVMLRYAAKDAEAEMYAARLEGAIREMLEQGTFVMHYQPVCRPDGTVLSLEALLRMPHPVLGMVPPSEFIPVAEQSRLIIPLGQWVFERVCRQIREWEDAGVRTVPVAVNISALQFLAADFCSTIERTMKKFDVPTSKIVLELTESTVLRNVNEALDAMQSLSKSGIRFSIDDFGTGYSSLSRLREMPVAMLKIDRSFVQQMTPEDTLVEAIITLAHALGMSVVAEGVETAEQLEILRLMGCDSIQGFLLGRPMDADVTAELLARS